MVMNINASGNTITDTEKNNPPIQKITTANANIVSNNNTTSDLPSKSIFHCAVKLVGICLVGLVTVPVVATIETLSGFVVHTVHDVKVSIDCSFEKHKSTLIRGLAICSIPARFIVIGIINIIIGFFLGIIDGVCVAIDISLNPVRERLETQKTMLMKDLTCKKVYAISDEEVSYL